MEGFIYVLYDIANISVKFAVTFALVEVIQYIRVLRVKKIMEIKDHES